MQLTNNVTDVALIFEGGGMRASYTAAVVSVLLEAGIHFNWVAGISAGGSNAANYVSRDSERARQSFVEFASDPSFGGTASFLRGKGLYNARYIYDEAGLPDGALPFDFKTFIANPAQVRIGAFQVATGATVYWSKTDMQTLPDLMHRVRAGATLPFIMPPPVVDGQVYFDGGLGSSAGIPLDIAKADGFTKFLVILTRERNYRKSKPRLSSLMRSYLRPYPALAEALETRWRAYNEVREELFELEERGAAQLFVPEHVPASNTTRDVATLQASFDLGYAQANSELPTWREFLGLN